MAFTLVGMAAGEAEVVALGEAATLDGRVLCAAGSFVSDEPQALAMRTVATAKAAK